MMALPNLNSRVLRHFLEKTRFHAVRTTRARRYGTEADAIRIPNRIPRGPTDILEALASTVKRDPTAAHYKFHDDPFLIPTSNKEKWSYALAQEAGRKAATWIKEQHPELFQHKVAEPFIQAFAPPEKLIETTPVTEDLLMTYINTCQVANAVTVYGKLENVSSSVKQSFLEFLCFYNETEQFSEDLIEERWFKIGAKPIEHAHKTWKDNGLAERVFNSIEPKTAEAYCAIISGMGNHGHGEGAWEYFKQMQSAGFVPNVITFNSILRAISVLQESGDNKWNCVQDILAGMAKAGIKPDVRTLNAALYTISSMAVNRRAREAASRMIAEFKSIGILPSLASYYYLLKIYCRDRNTVSNILVDIVLLLEQNGIPPLQDVHDVAFFSHAMLVCHQHLHDIELARRLDRLISSQSNTQALIGDGFKESIYYRNYMLLISRSESPDVLMETYRKLTPNIYVPEPMVFEDILITLKECSAAHYVPELWTDALYMDLANRDTIVQATLRALASGSGLSKEASAKKKSADEADQADPILVTAKSIESYVERMIADAAARDRHTSLGWDGPILGNLMKIYLQYNDMKAAISAMTRVNTLRQQMVASVPVGVLNHFLDKCIELQEASVALMVIDYAMEVGLPDEAHAMARKIVGNQLKLDERQAETLKTILRQVGISKTTSS